MNLVLRQKKMDLIPNSIFRKFGCEDCDYRRSKDCIAMMEGNELPEKNKDGMDICDFKREWVLSLLPEYKAPPSFERVNLDISKALNMNLQINEWSVIKKIRKKLERMGDGNKGRKKLEKELNKAKSWYSVWSKRALEYDNLSVDRQTPKKVEVTEKIIRPQDIYEWRKKARVVDAEFEDEKTRTDEGTE